MTDPRKEPGWKQKRYEDRQLAMLGAILDALHALKSESVTPPAAQTPRTRSRNAG
jgi:hypothetical protein